MNTSDYLLDNGEPGAVALVEAGGSVSYGELRTAAGRLAAELASQGLPARSRVGIVGANSLFWVAAYLATMKLDHVAVPFSDTLSPADVERQSAWTGCTAVFMDRRKRRSFAEAFPGGVVIIGDDALRRNHAPYWPGARVTDPDADAALMFTSGTTAGPRVVRVTHRDIQANTDLIVSRLGLRADDRMRVIMPFFYCCGASLLHTHLRAGASLAICDRRGS